jgi:hypothetical protein
MCARLQTKVAPPSPSPHAKQTKQTKHEKHQKNNKRSYITNSHAKLVLVLDEPAPRDDELARVLRRLHALYADATCNPFYTYGAPLTALSFRAGVEAVLSSYVPSSAS